MLSGFCRTFTFLSWLFELEADTAFGAEAGAASAGLAVAWAPGITAGFTAGAGAPGAGLAVAGAGWGAGCVTPAASRAALLSLACFCCSDFAMLRALSMASVFCAAALAAEPLTISAIARMPVSFIAVFIGFPTSQRAHR